ncbi:MAG TPA: hypothetical protein DHW42_02165 [Candidatus Marinimicrobia bacterium]|nr:hypothetical protein [Candidatus Neomarinimicrobiota bacterium]
MRQIKSILLFSILTASFLFTANCEKEVIKVKDDEDLPNIETAPSVIALSDTTATIFWETDEPCSVQVFYGLVGSQDTLVQSDSEFRQIHVITLENLRLSSEYYYKTASTDVAGNVTNTPGNTFITSADTANFLQYAWAKFSEGFYQQSLDYFQQYHSFNPEEPDALTGTGWCYLKIDSLDWAISAFDDVLETDGLYVSALMGISVSYYKNQNYIFAMQNCEELFLVDSLYTFQHDSAYSPQLIRFITLDSYSTLNMIDKAIYYINNYFSGFYINSEDSLWTIGDSTYAEIEAAVSVTVDSIQSYIWGDDFP